MKDGSKDAVMDEAKTLLPLISDYWSKPSVAHIEHWLEQFDASVRLPLITELRHILSESYFSSDRVREFLKDLIKTPKLVGNDPAAFWKNANFFSEQQGGSSQSELLELFGALLKSECGIRLNQCGSTTGPVIYIDDVLFSGNRLVNDLRPWIPSHAPKNCELHAIFMGIHSGGSFYAKEALPPVAREAQKKLTIHFWRALPFESFSNRGGATDVYRLRTLPADEATAKYIESLAGKPALMRAENELNSSRFFSSEEQRNFLEQTFWTTGLHIRDIAVNLKDTHRPLGYTSTNSNNKLGFGSLVVTYRNCANNCPLAYWVGAPWYPLFPRKTNR